MREVKGFLTNDGQFCEIEEEAIHLDTMEALLDAAAVAGVNGTKLLEAVKLLHKPIMDFTNACYKLPEDHPYYLDEQGTRPVEINKGGSRNRRGKEDTKGKQPQSDD